MLIQQPAMLPLPSLLDIVRLDSPMEFTNVNSKLIRALCLCAGVLFTSVSTAQSRSESELEAEGVYLQALEQIEAELYVNALASLRQVQSRYPSYSKIAGVQSPPMLAPL
jgi:hypothetical protein